MFCENDEIEDFAGLIGDKCEGMHATEIDSSIQYEDKNRTTHMPRESDKLSASKNRGKTD